MIRTVFALLCLVAAVGGAPALAETAVLRGLDKITGQARDFSAPIGRSVRFGTLEIIARDCAKRPAEETPEVSIYVEVFDTPPAATGEEAQRAEIFHGWMFASSPGLKDASLDHAVYDVWAIDCRS
jgi:hypothetical protein